MMTSAVNRRVLFIITGDPRQSARPAEAVRIAAGLSAGRNVEVTACFCSAAALVVGDAAEELVDGDSIARYLPLLAESGSVCVPQGAAASVTAQTPMAHSREITDQELARLAANSDAVIRF